MFRTTRSLTRLALLAVLVAGIATPAQAQAPKNRGGDLAPARAIPFDRNTAM